MKRSKNKYVAENIEVSCIDYKIEYNHDDKIAVISPSFKIYSKETFPLAVSVLLDNHELLPPELIKAKSNEILSCNLKSMKIIRPILHLADEEEDVRCYMMSLQLYVVDSDEPIFCDNRRIYIVK